MANTIKVRTVKEWKDSICKVPIKTDMKLQVACEWIVLRPNDEITHYGLDNFCNKVKAVEELLDTPAYIQSELRAYYYDMKNNEHDFHTFERWKIYGRTAISA